MYDISDPKETPNHGEFIYFKTIEYSKDVGKSDEYQVISCPWSKRIFKHNGDGTVTYYMFAGWKVVKGAECILRENGTPAETNDILNLVEKISFRNLGDYDGNNDVDHPLFEIEFEATWTVGNAIPSDGQR